MDKDETIFRSFTAIAVVLFSGLKSVRTRYQCSVVVFAKSVDPVSLNCYAVII